MTEWKNLDELQSYQKLQQQPKVDLTAEMAGEKGADRVRKYAAPMAGGLCYSYAAKQVNEEILRDLCDLAKEAQLTDKFKELYNGAVVNTGEKRRVLHHLTRGQLEPDLRNMKLHASQVRERMSFQVDYGLNLLSLLYEGKVHRVFCFYMPEPHNHLPTVRITVKHNAGGENRTKIRIVSPHRIPEGRLCYTVPDCPIPFRFPTIEPTPEGQCFVLERPHGDLQFALQEFKPPIDAELFPPDCESFTYGLGLQVEVVQA